MKHLIPAAFLFFLVLSLQLKAEPSAQWNQLSLEDIDNLANFLMMVSDGHLKDSTACSISATDALAMMPPLQAQMDAKLEDYVKKINAATLSQMANCNTTCHCGTYLSAIEKFGFNRLNIEQKKIYRQVETFAANQSSATLLKCLEKVRWDCSSPFLANLLAEAKENN